MDLKNIKYYYPFEERYADLSTTPWQIYDNDGVVKSSKTRLLKLYKISRDSLYKNDPDDYYYHPVSIAQCALGCYNIMVSGKSLEHEKIFWANINWLKNNGIEHKDAVVYPFPYGIPGFNSEAGWVSGMYQGQILSALVRAYLISNDDYTLTLCGKVWNSFSLDLGDKYGFRYKEEGNLWFEEAPQFPPSHILNGSIYAAWGLYDYMIINDSKELKKDWKESTSTIIKTIHLYDMGFWSYYDLKGTIASYYYHNAVHVRQLKILAEQTAEDLLLEYSEKWSKYGKSILSINMKRIISLFRLIKFKLFV